MTFTDDQVRTLPLDRGKSELLDELVRDEHEVEPTVVPRRGRRTWRISVAAAVAVAVAVGGPVLLLRGGEGPDAPDGAVVDDSRALLVAPGWKLMQVFEDARWRFADYARDGENLSLTWLPADQYAQRFADRDNGPGKRRVGETDLVGEQAVIWAYTEGSGPETEHEAMTEPRGGWFLEARGSQMDLAEFESLLPLVVRRDAAGFAAGTADDDVLFVDDATIAEMLAQVPLPPGHDHLSEPLGGFTSRYLVLQRMARDVGCAWVEAYAAGRRDEALAALADPASWPLLAASDDAASFAADPRKMGEKLEQGIDPEMVGRC